MGESRSRKVVQGHPRSMKSTQIQKPGLPTPSQWPLPVNLPANWKDLGVRVTSSHHQQSGLHGLQGAAEIWVRSKHGRFPVWGRGSGQGDAPSAHLACTWRQHGGPVTGMDADSFSLRPQLQRRRH